MTEPCFTVQIPAHVGFTDQLMQLSLLYRVGCAAGMTFRLAPLISSRTAEGFWERFDLSRVFPVIGPAEMAMPRHPIDLSLARLMNEGVVNGAGLLGLVRSQWPPPGTLGEFRLLGESRTFLMRIISAEPAQFDCGLSGRMQEVFAPPALATRPPDSSELGVLAHVRCGDAADIALFPNTGYLAWHRVIARTTEVRQNPFIGIRILVDALRAHLAPRPLRCTVFSDGYSRTLTLLGECQNTDDGPAAGEVALLRAAVGVHQRAAELLMQDDCIRAEIGESLDSLCSLLWEAQQSELIVITGNQRMLPKFLALLGRRERVPAVLLLESDADSVRFVRAAGLSDAYCSLISLSHHGDPLAPLRAYLQYGRCLSDRPRVKALSSDQGIGAYCISELIQCAADLESRGQRDDAGVVYEWLAVLTDFSPVALDGRARCIDAADADSRRQIRDAAKRFRGQLVAEANSLISLGRLGRAGDVIHAARERWGDWEALARCRHRLESLTHVKSVEEDLALNPKGAAGSEPGSGSGK